MSMYMGRQEQDDHEIYGPQQAEIITGYLGENNSRLYPAEIKYSYRQQHDRRRIVYYDRDLSSAM